MPNINLDSLHTIFQKITDFYTWGLGYADGVEIRLSFNISPTDYKWDESVTIKIMDCGDKLFDSKQIDYIDINSIGYESGKFLQAKIQEKLPKKEIIVDGYKYKIVEE